MERKEKYVCRLVQANTIFVIWFTSVSVTDGEAAYSNVNRRTKSEILFV